MPMCGRYRLTSRERYLAEHFGLEEDELIEWSPRYNIAPTQQVLVVRQDRLKPIRTLSLMRWGLIPYWSQDASIGDRTINAMSETASEKPAFREAMRKRRCLVPADGFFEWKKLGSKRKQPYNIGMLDDSLFAFAGLWDSWRSTAGETIESCSILTTDANVLTRDIHDRMPAILKPEDYDLWLDTGVTGPERVQGLLRPFDPRLMKMYPLSSAVSNVNNDNPQCIQEAPPDDEAAPMLF
jgi:putative SOS response-associated peptidase YedK